MNKKVVLSVLSATVFASMAASAFAAPKSGLYIGGNVDKYYSMDTLFKMNSATSDQFSNELVQAGFSNLIYVDFDGKGASISEIMNATDFEDAKKDLTADKFEGVYANITADGSSDGTYDPRKDTPPVDGGDLKVDSVSAINGKTVEIKFSKAVKKSTVINTNLLINTTFTPADANTPAVNGATAAAKLSTDGKTLTVTPGTSEFFGGKYVVNISDLVEDTEGNKMTASSNVYELNDTAKPSISGPAYTANNIATFTFSEPVNANAAAIEAALTIKNKNGAVVPSTGLITVGANNTFTLDMTGWAATDNYTLTFVGLKDYSGKLIDPNPVTFTVKNSFNDGEAPAVTGLTAVKAGEMVITFSEPVKSVAGVVGTFDLDGAGAPVDIDVTAGTGNATVDATGKVVTVKDATLTSGLHSVTIAGFVDASGTAGTAFTKVLNFAGDTVAPTVASQEIKAISGVQNLVVKFSENISLVAPAPAAALTGSYVDKDGVTHSGVSIVAATAYDPDGDGIQDSVNLDISALNPGTYSVSLAADLVTDGTNKNAAKSLTFTIVEPNGAKPTIVDADSNPANGYSGISVQAAEDKVTVQFNKNVTDATAKNLANYKVQGQSVFSKAIFDGSRDTVTLTLNPGVITIDGLRELTIANVADDLGNVMLPVETQVNFVENIKPTVKSAELTGTGEITLTFSENMTDTSLTDGGDFEVWVDGKKATISGVTGTNDTYKVAFGTPVVTDLTKPVEIKVLGTNNVTDAASTPNSLATEGTVTVKTN